MATSPKPDRNPDEPILMDHEYDGIREYDQRLPNWWLATLYGAIVFAAGYWYYYFQSNIGKDDRIAVNAEISEIESKRLAAAKDISDDILWQMSKKSDLVAAGEATFKGTCAPCHGTDGAGVKGIGFRLTDKYWVHGNTPKAVFDNINNGIKYNGVPTGMASQAHLGAGKIAEVVAFLMSKQTQGDMPAIAREDEPSQGGTPGSHAVAAPAPVAAAPATTGYTDDELWKLAKDPAAVAAGEASMKTICVACHSPALTGMKGLGFNLMDNTWVHGVKPSEIFANIANGITVNGAPTTMMSQKAVLGSDKKIAEVVAFLLSKQDPAAMKAIPRADEPSQR